jgi:hypothetical protein
LIFTDFLSSFGIVFGRFGSPGVGDRLGVAEGTGFGLLLFDLTPPLGVSVFSLGREVRKAPRTSSWSCSDSGTAAITTAKLQIITQRKILNFINNLLSDISRKELIMLNANVKDDRIANLVR